MAKSALIYGILGQDGHYLSKFLSEKGYSVAGVSRTGAILPGAKAYAADLSGESKQYLFPIDDFSPDEIYNLAGISNPRVADADPSLASKVNAMPAAEILKKILDEKSKARFFQASSCYMFSGSQKVSESTAPSPGGAYGRSKLEAHLAVAEARKKGAYACSGILFNHESPLRTLEFATRKISSAAAEFSLGRRTEPLLLGNLDVSRDWGFAGDYVEAMWLMLQQEAPGDYVIATGKPHTVRDFCMEAFSYVGLDYEKHVQVDKRLIRASETNMVADISKIESIIGWKPKTDFRTLVRMMVDADVEFIGQGGIS